jgi:hypothetical protein
MRHNGNRIGIKYFNAFCINASLGFCFTTEYTDNATRKFLGFKKNQEFRTVRGTAEGSRNHPEKVIVFQCVGVETRGGAVPVPGPRVKKKRAGMAMPARKGFGG